MSTSEATSTNKAEVKYTKSDGTFVKVRAMPALEDGTMWIAGKEYKKVKCELLSQRKRFFGRDIMQVFTFGIN